MSTLDARKNFSIANLSTGYSAGATSIIVETGTGALFPDPGTAGAFNLVWWNYSDYKNPSDDPNVEIVRCTARTTDTLTITRAQEDTLASAKNVAGKTYKVMLAPTKKMIDDIETELDSKSDVGHTHTASEITDFDTEVSNNTDVSANTSARHTQNTDTILDDGGANEVTATEIRGHIDNTSNPHGVTKTQVGLGNVTDEAQIPLTQKAAANGVASLGADGKVPTSQLSALVFTDVFVVASQVDQLALTAEEGDVAIRTDLNKSYIHNGGVAGTMADWSELLTPTDAVLSVNGQTGVVSLTTSHITEGSNQYFTNGRAQSAMAGLYEVPLTISTGLTRATNTITNNLSVGVSGGQSVIGGTGVTDVLSLIGTTGNGTAGNAGIQLKVGNNGGTVAMTVLNNGNVGIGTTSPFVKLDVNDGNIIGNAVNGAYIVSDQATNNNAYLASNAYLSGGNWTKQYAKASAIFGSAGSGTSKGFYVYTSDGTTPGTISDWVERLSVQANGNVLMANSGGNVGINTTSPSTKLHVISTSNLIRFGYDVSNYFNIDVSSTGGVTFDAVGSGAGFTFNDHVTLADKDLVLGTTTGTKIGTSTSQKLGLWNTTPIVQPTTGIAAATFVTNTSLIANDTATFDGYTIGQVVKALRNIGVLA